VPPLIPDFFFFIRSRCASYCIFENAAARSPKEKLLRSSAVSLGVERLTLRMNARRWAIKSAPIANCEMDPSKEHVGGATVVDPWTETRGG
jgi:hypothetical protein